LLRQKEWKNTPEEKKAELFEISKEKKSEITDLIKSEQTLCSVKTS